MRNRKLKTRKINLGDRYILFSVWLVLCICLWGAGVCDMGVDLRGLQIPVAAALRERWIAFQDMCSVKRIYI